LFFLGLLENEEYFRLGMSRLGVSPPGVEKSMQRAPVVIKEEMTLGGMQGPMLMPFRMPEAE
jgi:hypothetical protein